jgi:hypothetical protein
MYLVEIYIVINYEVKIPDSLMLAVARINQCRHLTSSMWHFKKIPEGLILKKLAGIKKKRREEIYMTFVQTASALSEFQRGNLA